MPPADGATGSWALTGSGHLNWPLITDFASVGMHDMSVAGKAITDAYYPGELAPLILLWLLDWRS